MNDTVKKMIEKALQEGDMEHAFEMVLYYIYGRVDENREVPETVSEMVKEAIELVSPRVKEPIKG